MVGEHTLDQVSGRWTNLAPFLLWKRDFSPEDKFKYSCIAGREEGRLSCEHDVENDPQRPNVALLVVLLLDHLRSHIVGLNPRKNTLPTLREVFS